MALTGIVQAANDGLLGVDIDGIVTATDAADLFASGFRFCARYISRAGEPGNGDLSKTEAAIILDAGLALMSVQHVAPSGWIPTLELGASNGVYAAYNSFVIGFPPGVNVWCDLEGISQSTPAQQVIDYCNSWYDAVDAAGFVPGLYVGANAILDGQALRSSLKFSHYWKSLSDVPDIVGRGYQLVQSPGQSLNGLGFDENRTQSDLLGSRVLLLAPDT